MINIHKFLKLWAEIPRKYVRIPPIYLEKISPRFQVAINTANIVPSIFFGQILQARTKIGVKFNSPTIYMIALSPKLKALSGIPKTRLYLVINSN